MSLFGRIRNRIARSAGRALSHIVDRIILPSPSTHPMNLTSIKRAAQHLKGQPRVLVCVGSGLSAESGVPTFRGPGGMFYEAKIARLTHVDTFESDQRREMMGWYQERRDLLDTIKPNPGHHALIGLCQTGNYTIATQNVDHLLEAASDEADFRPEILHLHGSLLEVRCHDCGRSFEDLTLDLETLPTCEHCGGPLRPGVVWFGESLPHAALQTSAEASQQADVCLILGTSGLVHPAAALPETARQFGATLIEVNPNPTALSDISDIIIRGKTGEVLPVLLKEVERLNKIKE